MQEGINPSQAIKERTEVVTSTMGATAMGNDILLGSTGRPEADDNPESPASAMGGVAGSSCGVRGTVAEW